METKQTKEGDKWVLGASGTTKGMNLITSIGLVR